MPSSKKKDRREFLQDALGAGAFLAAAQMGARADASYGPARGKVTTADATTQTTAVRQLLRRRVPAVASRFSLSLIDKEAGSHVFEVESAKAGEVILRGSSGVALACGLKWYLSHVCHRQMSWCGSRLDLDPADLAPVPQGKFRNVLPHRHVAYMNYCTLSYSMAWWDWKRWEWEIDFMAMNGVTMPLGMVGLEGAWYSALLRMGLSDEEARQFLVGPAYFAWEWMQNIEGQCGPLPSTWIDSHVALGRRVLDRERSFGMTPVQQGFSGHVPRIFITRFPEARIRQQPSWCGFPGVAQLDPLDPLFQKFGRIFLEEEARIFGLGGYYAADPFHESAPPKDIAPADLPRYLESVGHSIHTLFDSMDRSSTWVMQSWSIRKEIACAVPKGRLLVVDLAGEKWKTTQGFWGYDFCVGQLHNFGGRINLHGDLAHLAANPFVHAKKQYPATAAGTGIFMEGIIQNPVFYDLYFDVVWRNESIVLEDWLKEYALRRYGISGGPAAQAWTLLREGPYREGTSGVESSSMIAARPALHCKKSGPNAGFILPYPPQQLIEAWTLLLDDDKRCAEAQGYRFDVVDVGRQVLSNLSQVFHKRVADAFAARDQAALEKSAAEFIDLLSDTDRLCETRVEYRFGEWLEAARRWGTDDAETALYDKNASMLVTCWGPENEPRIFDYSWREWSGLIRSYYIPRWQQFHAMLAQKLAAGEAYSEEGLPQVYGREAWRANAFYASLADWESEWINTPKNNWKSLDVGSGDEIACARALYAKWKPALDAAYA